MAEKIKPNPKNQKLTLDEYQKFKAKQGKRRFKWGYPLIVTLAIFAPIVFLFLLILNYFLYIRNL